MKALILLLTLLSISLSTRAQDSPAKQWINAITKRDQRDFLAVIHENLSREWPTIEPEALISSMPLTQQPEFRLRILLAKQVLLASKAVFTGPIVSSPSLRDEIKLAAITAAKIKAQKGYVNEILSDAIFRGAILHISEWLVQHPADLDAVQSMVDSLQVPELDILYLVRTYKKNDSKISAINIVDDIPVAEGNLFQQLASVGIPNNTIMSLFARPELATQHITNLDVLSLSMRLYVTKSHSNSLREACEYVRRGGHLNYAELSDFAKYKKLMADRIYSRQEVRQLSVEPNYGEGIINLLKIQERGSDAAIQYSKATFD